MARPVPSRPNLLFVFPDQMRRSAVGCMGQDPVLTPALDAFAAESRVLTSAISNYPLCSPYRAMLLTGTHPFINGVTSNCNDQTAPLGIELRTSQVCLSDVLSAAGYNCGYLGKWHLEAPHPPYVEPPREDGIWDEFTPPGPRRHSCDFWYSYGCCDEHLHPHYWDNTAPRGAPIHVDQWSPEHEADIAIAYLRNADGRQRDPAKPFALFWSLNPPHTPFQYVPSRYIDLYGDASPKELLTRPNVDLYRKTPNTNRARQHVKNYFAAITGLDEQFGRLLGTLRDAGLDGNTLVVFTSDHGEMMGSHDLMNKNGIYEESLGVPFLIRLPGRIPPGRDDLLLGTPDLMPTLLSLLGLADRLPPGVQGQDLSAALSGQPGPRPEAQLYYAIDSHHPRAGRRGLRTPRFTFQLDRSGPKSRTLLFDALDDPYQLHDLASDQRAMVRALTEQLHAMLTAVGDPWVR